MSKVEHIEALKRVLAISGQLCHGVKVVADDIEYTVVKPPFGPFDKAFRVGSTDMVITMSDIYGVQRVIVCAACRYGDLVICSARHHDPVMNAQIRLLKESDEVDIINQGEYEQGFIDQWGNFLNREDALTVAIAAGQVNVRRQKTFPDTELFSEDLY